MDCVTFEIAEKLREKGFRGKCLYHYKGKTLKSNSCMCGECNRVSVDDIMMSCNSLVSHFEELRTNDIIADAPTIDQVLEWIRVIHCIHISIVVWDKGWYADIQFFEKEDDKAYSVEHEYQTKDYPSYEQAALAGIEYVLDNFITI